MHLLQEVPHGAVLVGGGVHHHFGGGLLEGGGEHVGAVMCDLRLPTHCTSERRCDVSTQGSTSSPQNKQSVAAMARFVGASLLRRSRRRSLSPIHKNMCVVLQREPDVLAGAVGQLEGGDEEVLVGADDERLQLARPSDVLVSALSRRHEQHLWVEVRRLRAGEYVPPLKQNTICGRKACIPQASPLRRLRRRSTLHFSKTKLGPPFGTPRRRAAACPGPGAAHAEALPV